MADENPSGAAAQTGDSAEEPVVFFKKSKGKGNIRKRPRDEESGDGTGDAQQTAGGVAAAVQAANVAADESAVVKKKKDAEGKGIAATTRRERDKEFLGVKFATTGTAELSGDQGATRTLEVDDNAGRAGNTAGQKGLRAGPQRSVAHLRVNARFDYQPDICKDYKETGYCGYGDSCKFLHDRGDYKAGWQLDKDWDEEQKRKEKEAAKYAIDGPPPEEEEEPDDDLPFACLICRQDFKDPIQTKCGHYFCQSCAVAHHRKSPKCYACNAPTMGIFSIAKGLLEKVAERKKRIAEREEAARQLNAEVSDEEDDEDEDEDQESE